MRALAVLAIAFLVLAVTPAAEAEVDINPGTDEPTILLKGEKVRRPNTSTAPPVRGAIDRQPENFRCSDKTPSAGITCEPTAGAPTEAEPEEELTAGDILQAVREIGLPSLELQIQPGEETLVNIETIFYTEPRAFEHSIDLLGFDIDLSASPVSYRWVHDDGTASTTSRPGRPYPAMDVTHRYRKPDDVRPRVDVTYRVRYRVDGGAWQTIGQTLQAPGPAVELDVREAAPVLTRP